MSAMIHEKYPMGQAKSPMLQEMSATILNKAPISREMSPSQEKAPPTL